MEESIEPSLMKGFKAQGTQAALPNLRSLRLDPGPVGKEAHSPVPICQGYEGDKVLDMDYHKIEAISSGLSTPDNHTLTDDEDIFSKWGHPECAGNIRWGYRAPMQRLTIGGEEAYEKERECDLA
ncbi:hypothetical protein SESBI_35379 [Sesbania bispinosa]|nr:hypothetical protein SESBI_35379 [Sesbania bispinosa]